MITLHERISSQEKDKLKNQINSIISIHNMFCDIELVFMEDIIARGYFEEARKEVQSCGNAGLSMIYRVAIKNMTARLADLESDLEIDDEVETLRTRIYQLESENRKLRSIL